MKGGEFVLLGENTTQWERVYIPPVQGDSYFVRTFAGGDFIPVYCLRGGDFLGGGSITQHRHRKRMDRHVYISEMGIISVYIVHLANVAKLSTKCATNIETKS